MSDGAETIEAAFVGVVAPDTAAFRNAAFSVAGHKCQTNILKATARQGWRWSCILAYRPIPAFPGGRTVFVRACRGPLVGDLIADMPGFINLNPVKQIIWTLSVFARLAKWALAKRGTAKIICVYNLSRPPGIAAYLAARLSGSRILGLLYDVPAVGGPDPKNVAEWAIAGMTRWLIPRLDGRVVVTDAVARDLAPGGHYIVVDGGVEDLASHQVSETRADAETLTLGYAGSLWPINGIDVILKAMEMLPGLRLRLIFAGAGMLEAEVRAAAARDDRIEYRGSLGPGELRAMYASCDVMLNIRRTSILPTPYHFPSKLMEYFEAGRPLLSTAIGHLERDYGPFSFILDRDDAEAVAAGFRKVTRTDRSVLAEMGRRAREFVVTERTWRGQGERIDGYVRTRLLCGSLQQER